MLKRLFNRSSPIVRILEVVGIVNSYFFLRQGPEGAARFGFLFLAAAYLWVRICDLIPWYGLGPEGKKLGIRVHFEKALVPTSYILAIASSLCLAGIGGLSLAAVILADLCMLIVAPVNGILIWFHFHDREEMPVNYFSLGKYLTHPPTPSLTVREGATEKSPS